MVLQGIITAMKDIKYGVNLPKKYYDSCIYVFEEFLHEYLVTEGDWCYFYVYLLDHYPLHIHQFAKDIHNLKKKVTKETMMDESNTEAMENGMKLLACETNFLSWLRKEYRWYERK